MTNERTHIDSLLKELQQQQPRAIARAISIVEDGSDKADIILSSLDESLIAESMVLGVTGPPGAGKSTLTSQLIDGYRALKKRVGVVAVDPSSPLSGGAILGDRIRMMRHATDDDVIIRSMASRGRLGGLCAAAGAAVRIMAGAGCSVIIIETVGVGQSEIDIVKLADITTVVLAPGLGDDIQAMKAGLLEVADLVVVNKADCPGADTLVMDMETMVRERHGDTDHQIKVCQAVASEGQGVEELMAVIDDIDTRHRQQGIRERRRLEGGRYEVLDWALELLRSKLAAKIAASNMDFKGDPRLNARKIIDML